MALPEILFSVSLILGIRLFPPTKVECLQNLALEVILENQQIQFSPGRGFQHPLVSQSLYRDIPFSSQGAPAHIPAASCCDSAAGRVRRSLEQIVGHSVLYGNQPTPKTAPRNQWAIGLFPGGTGTRCAPKEMTPWTNALHLQWLPSLRGFKMWPQEGPEQQSKSARLGNVGSTPAKGSIAKLWPFPPEGFPVHHYFCIALPWTPPG